MGLLDEVKVAGKEGNFLKSGDFDGGLAVKVSRKPEVVDNTGDFGGATINGEPNKTILFRFEVGGEEYKYNTTSKRFLKAIRLCGADVGNIINISKTGEGFKTQYTIKQIEQEPQKTKAAETEVDVSDNDVSDNDVSDNSKDIKENTIPAEQEEPEEDWEKNFEEEQAKPKKEKEIEF